MRCKQFFVLAILAVTFGSANFVVAADPKPADKKTAAKPAESTGPKVTYDDDVRIVLREHCFTCHNQNTAKSGLAMDSYAKLMAGGSSGEVVVAGDLDGSRLWSLASHAEMPYMPPMQDKLPDAKLAILRRWIEGGALENSGSKSTVKKKASFALAANGMAGKPSGPAAMPEHVWRQPVVYTPRRGAVTALAASPWAPLVAVAGQREVVLYNSDTSEELGVLPFPEGTPYCIRFSRNGSLVLVGGGRGGQSGCAVAFDVKTGRRVLKVGDELDAVLACDINNDQSLIALGGPQKIVRIFSTQTLEQVAEIKKHTDWIYAVEFSPDGVLLATADRAAGMFVWEAATAREYLNLQGHKAAISAISWRDDSNVLASASEDGNVKMFEMQDGREIKNQGVHGNGALCVSFAHDGRLVTGGRDLLPKLWDGGGNPVKGFAAFPEAVMHAVFTYDGKRIVAADWSGQIRVIDIATGGQVGTVSSAPPTLAMLVEQTAAGAAKAKTAAEQAAAAYAARSKALVEKTAQAKAAADAAAQAVQKSLQAEAERAAAAKAVSDLAAPLKQATDASNVAQAALAAATSEQVQADKIVQDKTALAAAAKQAAATAKASVEKLTTEKSAAEKALADLTAKPGDKKDDKKPEAAIADAQKLVAQKTDDLKEICRQFRRAPRHGQQGRGGSRNRCRRGREEIRCRSPKGERSRHN